MLLIVGVLASGIICQWVAWRAKIPAILPLLAVGFLLGPVLNLIHPQESLGALFFPFVSLSVAIILFEGALTLPRREVRTVVSTVRNLVTIGALVTWMGGALLAHYLMGVDWSMALLFGALIIVTGPTVIAPLLRNVRPEQDVASILKWEGILIDPLGATVAVLVFDFIVAGDTFRTSVTGFLLILVLGLVLGAIGGYAIYFLLNRYLVPDYLRDVAVLSIVLSLFAISNAIISESGLLTVTVMGVFLANTDLRQLREIWFFKEKLSVLLISTLFIVLAGNIAMDDLMVLNWWRTGLLLAAVILLLRPIGVFLSTIGSQLPLNKRLFLSWIAPRGIVAAAVSALFAFELLEMGYEEARILEPLTFLVIIGTVVIQGSTAKLVANRLGVSEADPQGVLLMGSHRAGRELARALQSEQITVRLVDTNLNSIVNARLEGLNAYHGNILREFTESDLDLSGIGHLLALTRNDEANALACKHLEDEFGSSGVFQLPPRTAQDQAKGGASRFQLGRLLFAPHATFDYIEQMFDEGAVIKKTPLTNQFTFADFEKEYEGEYLLLMTIRNQQLQIATVDQPLEPQPGWTIISLSFDRDKVGTEKRDRDRTDTEEIERAETERAETDTGKETGRENSTEPTQSTVFSTDDA